MGSPIIGRTDCPECKFSGAHVKQSPKCIYRYCPECGSMHHAKTERQKADLLGKTRMVNAEAEPTPTPTPTVEPVSEAPPKAPPTPTPTPKHEAAPKAVPTPKPAAEATPTPTPTPTPVEKKRSSFFGLPV